MPDQARGNEEVSPPPPPAQLVAYLERTLTTIIEREQQMPARLREVDARDQHRVVLTCRYAVEMAAEEPGAQLERHSATTLETRMGSIVGDIVIAQGCNQRARCHRMILWAVHARAGWRASPFRTRARPCARLTRGRQPRSFFAAAHSNRIGANVRCSR